MKLPNLTRKDFLKLLALLPPAWAYARMVASPTGRALISSNQPGKPNVIILLLDTLSAQHTSLAGYRRATTPNLLRFAERATVYHAHYSAGNFTVPGTASLLTGLYPWTHRANQYGGILPEPIVDQNVFRFVGPDYFRMGYSQNPYADIFLYQFTSDLDLHIESSSFDLTRNTLYNGLFVDDSILAYQGVEGFSLRQNSGLPGAPILSTLNYGRIFLEQKYIEKHKQEEYPLGLPFTLGDTNDPYILADLFSGIQEVLFQLPPPFFSYFHLFPPHGPYLPSRLFVDMFDDGWKPPDKPMGAFPETLPRAEILQRQQRYDEFLAATDAHFESLLDFFETAGFFEDSYIILTSDHGELFERGVHGHTNEYLYEPIVRVPLLVSAPGQQERVDVYHPTSSTDVLPTILSILGVPLPASLEGRPLPGYAGPMPPDPDRPVYSFVSKGTPVHGRLGAYTIAMRRGDLKLIKYRGYKHIPETYELYDLRQDPEERQNLYAARSDLADGMRALLKAKEDQIDPPAREE